MTRARPGRGDAARRGMTLLGTVSLALVVSVLVVVSLPRLRGFVRGENEADARDTVRLLARELAAAEDPTAPVRELTRSDPVARALSDAEFLAGGILLRRHGYLFRVVQVDAGPAPPPPGGPGVVLAVGPRPAPRAAVTAWPWRHGETGLAALLATPDGRIFRHENREAAWNGPLVEGESLETWDGWQPLPN